MKRRPSWYRRTFRFPFSTSQLREDLDEEIAFHLEMRTRQLMEHGLSRDQAKAEAQRRFGDVEKIREDCFDLDRRSNLLDLLTTGWAEFSLDVRHALRSLAKQPLFALTAILALGVGIGATTSVFGLLDAVVLRPWPMPEPERIQWVAPSTAEGPRGVSPGLALAWQDRSRTFEHLTAFYEQSLNLTGPQGAERVAGRATTASYFDVLAVTPSLGRAFRIDEDRPNSERVAVLSHRLWARRFLSDPEILGRSVNVNGRPHIVVGVLPSSLDLTPSSPDVIVPLALAPSQASNFGGHYLTVLGRLRDGVESQEARQELLAILEPLQIEEDSSSEVALTLAPVGDVLVQEDGRRLWILFGAVLFVLLITCSNVAGLLLARLAARSQEIGIRASLGAGRGRIAAQLLNESLVLAGAGGALGILLAHTGVRGLVNLLPESIPRIGLATLDGRVLAFALLLTLLTSLFFGVAPAWRSSRLDLHTVLRSGGRQSGLGGGRDPVRTLFVASQVALSLLLLTGAGLLLRSALLLQQVPPGFEPQNVLTAELKLPEQDYPELPRALATYGALVEQVAAIPGVERVSLGTTVPLAGSTAGSNFAAEGRPLAPGSQVQARIHLVSPGYFETLGIPLVAGREFLPTDRADGSRVLLVNQTLARRLGLDEPLGVQLRTDISSFVDDRGRPFGWEVVGVTTDVKDRGLRSETQPAVYIALDQAPSAPWAWTGRRMLLAARTSIPPMSLVSDLKTAVAAVDENLPIYDAQSLDQRLRGSLAVERFNTLLLSALGLIGLFLASLGIYGLVAFFVNQRRHEMGVRIALGATASQLHRLVIGQGMRPVLWGLALGLLAAMGLSGVLESQLYGVAPSDPITYLAMVLVLGITALGASYLPARRASRADPRDVLRAQ